MKQLARVQLFAFLSIFAALPAAAQLTTVSGTVTDSSNLPYSGAQIKMQLVTTAGSPVTGQPTVTVSNQAQCVSGGFGSAPCQVPFQGTVGPFALSSTGSFTVNLQDNTLVTPAASQWLFSISLSPGEPPPVGFGPQSCSAQVTISGASQSVSTALSAACPLLTRITSAAPSNFLPGCNVTTGTCLGTATTAAIADWKQITDGTCANSSTAISWGTPNEITAADVGKVIDIFDNTNVWHNTSRTTIASVTSSTTGTISQNTTAGGCGTPVNFDVYTDSGIAFNTVELAIHNSAAHKGIIWYPCGVYGAGTPFWNQSGAGDSISYWGGGGGHAASTPGQCTVIKVSPAIFATVSGTGNSALVPANGDMRDLVLDGETIITTATNSFLISWNGVMDVSNFQAVNFFGTAGNTATLCHWASDNFQGRNVSCNFRDQKGVSCNSLNTTMQNPQFSGNPGLDLADCYATFTGGAVGTNATGGAQAALTSTAGSGTVMSTFTGTMFLGGPSSSPAIISITKPAAAAVQVNLFGVSFNCGHGSNTPLLNIGSGAIVQMSSLGNSNSTVTTGCPGTPTIANAGTFIDGGANGWGAPQMTVAFSGAGSYIMNCNSWQIAPTISSGFGTSPSIASGQNPCTFRVNVGTGGVATSGVISFTQAAPTGWNCTVQDATTNDATRQTAFSTTTATVTAAVAWTASDILIFHCDPF